MAPFSLGAPDPRVHVRVLDPTSPPVERSVGVVDFHQDPERLAWLGRVGVEALLVEARDAGSVSATLLLEQTPKGWTAWKGPAGPQPLPWLLSAMLGAIEHLNGPVRLVLQPQWADPTVLRDRGYGQVTPFTTLLVPATGTDEALLGRMRPSVRSRVRRARRAGLAVEEGPRHAEPFFRVLDENLAGSDSPDRPTLEEILTLASLPQVRLVVALHGAQLAAGSMCFEDERSLEARYVATATEFRSTGALNLVHFETVRRARDAGKSHLDLSGWSADRSNDKTAAINRFKGGFGGVVYEYPTYERMSSTTCRI